jgi:HPt (histidine-containing phosphotransfer) domain-containing protein
MNDYMTKPYRSKDLYYKITRALGSKQDQPMRLESADTFETPLKALAAGDLHFELEMLETMSSSFATDFDGLRTSFESGDVTAVRAVSHRIKSSCALAGETEFAQWLEILEYESDKGLGADVVANAYSSIMQNRETLLKRIADEASLIREKL